MQQRQGVGTLEGSAVHVAEQAHDGDVADGTAEEEFLDGLRRDGLERRQQEQQLAEAVGLGGVARTHVLAQRQLGLVLERGYGSDVTQRAAMNHCNTNQG